MLEQKVIDAQTCIASSSFRAYFPVFPSGLNRYTGDMTATQGSGRDGDFEQESHAATGCAFLKMLPSKNFLCLLGHSLMS